MAILKFTYKGQEFEAWAERLDRGETRFEYTIMNGKIDETVDEEVYSFNYNNELFLNGEKIHNPELFDALRSAQ